MSEHIPGPWSCCQESIDPEWWIVTIRGGLIVANVNAHFRQEANARLIAAAPDLLAALQDCAEALELARDKLGMSGAGDGKDRRADAPDTIGASPALRAASAAISKATRGGHSARVLKDSALAAADIVPTTPATPKGEK